MQSHFFTPIKQMGVAIVGGVSYDVTVGGVIWDAVVGGFHIA